jgi:hypothetical protein
MPSDRGVSFQRWADTRQLQHLVKDELGTLHPVASISQLFAHLVPLYSGYRIRDGILRIAGWKIDRTTLFSGAPNVVRVWQPQAEVLNRPNLLDQSAAISN